MSNDMKAEWKKKQANNKHKKTVKINLTLRVIEIHIRKDEEKKTTLFSIGSMRSFRYFRTQDQSLFDVFILSILETSEIRLVSVYPRLGVWLINWKLESSKNFIMMYMKQEQCTACEPT